jgi:hypothetical protein
MRRLKTSEAVAKGNFERVEDKLRDEIADCQRLPD